ncbi:hypothetical protein FRB90_000413, partial [Tulasnella sp. 427]
MALERSRGQLLDVTWSDVQGHDTGDSLAELVKHAHRWRSANITLTDESLLKVGSVPAPKLEALAIAPALIDQEDPLDQPQELPTAAQLFDGCTPQLKALKINFIWLSWEDVSYSRLKTLDVSMKAGGLPRLSTVIQMLSHCDQLETLKLSLPIVIPDIQSQTIPTVTLPEVKVLEIQEMAPLALLRLFLRVSFPGVESIRLQHGQRVAFHVGTTVRAVGPAIQRWSQTSRSAHVTLHEDEGVGFRFFDPVNPSSTADSTTGISFIRMSWDSVLDRVDEWYPL